MGKIQIKWQIRARKQIFIVWCNLNVIEHEQTRCILLYLRHESFTSSNGFSRNTFRIVCTWLHSRELKWFDCIGIGSQTSGSDHTCALQSIRLFISAPLSSFNTLAHCIRACISVTSLFRSTCQFYMRRARVSPNNIAVNKKHSSEATND